MIYFKKLSLLFPTEESSMNDFKNLIIEFFFILMKFLIHFLNEIFIFLKGTYQNGADQVADFGRSVACARQRAYIAGAADSTATAHSLVCALANVHTSAQFGGVAAACAHLW